MADTASVNTSAAINAAGGTFGSIGVSILKQQADSERAIAEALAQAVRDTPPPAAEGTGQLVDKRV
jgi:hypothetical protein